MEVPVEKATRNRKREERAEEDKLVVVSAAVPLMIAKRIYERAKFPQTRSDIIREVLIREFSEPPAALAS